TMLNAGGLKNYCEGYTKLNAEPRVSHLAGAAHQGNQAQAQLFKADVSLLLEGSEVLQEGIFGPCTVIIEVADRNELVQALAAMRGQLTATLIGENDELAASADLVALLERKAGRLLLNGYPTGV